MCLQYQRARGRPGRTRMMTWRGGYHGDTFAAMSVCDPDGGMHSLWQGFLPEQVFADVPPSSYAPEYDEHLAAVAAAHADELAGIIVEPVVQGAGGMRFHDPRHLRALREIADGHDLLLVFDEIATGFGRTGRAVRRRARRRGAGRHVRRQGPDRRLPHARRGAVHAARSPRPSATSAAAAGSCTARRSWGTRSPPPSPSPASTTCCARRLAGRGRPHRATGCGRAWSRHVELPGVRDVRVLGAIGVVQLDHPVDVPRPPRPPPSDHGVWLRPFRDLVYTMPPYVTPADDVARIAGAVVAAAEAG